MGRSPPPGHGPPAYRDEETEPPAVRDSDYPNSREDCGRAGSLIHVSAPSRAMATIAYCGADHEMGGCRTTSRA